MIINKTTKFITKQLAETEYLQQSFTTFANVASSINKISGFVLLNCPEKKRKGDLAFQIICKKKSFYLDIERDTILYQKIFCDVDFVLSINNKYFFDVGELHISAIVEFRLNERILVIEVIDKSSEESCLEYRFKDKDFPIILGRGDCEIKINCKSVSKNQFNLNLNKDGNIVIQDGFNNKESRNGTWLLCVGKTKLKSGSIYKYHKKLFKIDF